MCDGHAVSAAQAQLENDGLVVSLEFDYSDSVGSDKVISTSPKARASGGPKVIRLPSLQAKAKKRKRQLCRICLVRILMMLFR